MNNPFGLTDGQVAEVRAALIALGLRRRLLMGERAYTQRSGHNFTDEEGYCALGRALSGEEDEGLCISALPYPDIIAGRLHGDETVETGFGLIVLLNDAGELDSLSKMAVLLSLVEE